MHRAITFIIIVLILSLLTAAIFYDAATAKKSEAFIIKERAAIAKQLKAVDLCLSTEARYTRHIVQSDIFSPFQDSPSAKEHFPSGALLFVTPAKL